MNRRFFICCLISTLGPSVMGAEEPQWLSVDIPSHVQSVLATKEYDLPAERFQAITPTRRETAKLKLKDISILPLEENYVFFYWGKEKPIIFPHKAYLVRAVFSNEKGYFRVVSSKENDLIVSYQSPNPGKEKKTLGLVVFLDKEPKNVYVIEEKIDR